MTLSPHKYNEDSPVFSYIKGPIKVYKSWGRPTEVKFNAWLMVLVITWKTLKKTNCLLARLAPIRSVMSFLSIF